MEVVGLGLLWIGLAILTAAVAKRYNRDPFTWGVFGFLVFVIAMPLLLYFGPSERPVEPRRVERDLSRKPIVRRVDDAIEEEPEPAAAERLASSSPVVQVLAGLTDADFLTLSALSELEPPQLADEVNVLMEFGLVAADEGKLSLTPFARWLLEGGRA